MASLTDMEELIHRVPEKETSEYLYEAYRCYGAGAYRATIVITNIALFEGLRSKINALAPVSKVCKEVADAVNPLADAQKVFETPLIHRLKSSGIISDFEAERLEQLNKHRNKSAHPSGHFPTAEEARFVFSEAINLFLSKPIRQTSYIVDRISSDLKGNNFFPSNIISDIKSVVSQEVENLDELAWPFLLARVDALMKAGDPTEKRNAESFVLGAATLRTAAVRSAILAKIMVPRLSSTDNSAIISMIITCDPLIVDELTPPEIKKLDKLICHQADSVGFDTDTTKLSSPVTVSSRILKLSSLENLKKLSKFYELILKKCPLSETFIRELESHSEILEAMSAAYLADAGSSTFDVANRFARRMGDLDAALAETFNRQFAFEVIARVVRAGEIGAYSAINVSDSGFANNPKLRANALKYSRDNVAQARVILKQNLIAKKLSEFRKNYLKD